MTSIVPVPDDVQIFLKEIGSIAKQLGMNAYAVGGCVRDWLLGISGTKDLDVSVEGDGVVVARSFAAAFEVPVTEHEPFHTASLELPLNKALHPLRLDLVTARKETYSHSGAYPVVTHGSIRDDLYRRDFTINAMAAALDADQCGKLIDPFSGRRDLFENHLRILHPQSFMDDPSRILRGIRFAHRFGLKWERKTQKALHEALRAGALGRLNIGRVHKELLRMSEERNPKACFEDLAALLDSGRPKRG